MKFFCEKSFLQNAVNTASRAAAAKSAVSALEGLLLEAENEVSITGYNLKTGIKTAVSADISERGSIVVNSRLFGDIIRRLDDDVVCIETGENYLVKIVCGMSEFEIMGIPSSDYPELPSVDYESSLSIPESTLKAMIGQTIFAVSDNEARPIHTGSLFDIENNMLTIVSVDGYRLALRRETLDGIEDPKLDKTSFVVPGYALSEVEKILSDGEEDVKITVGSKHVMFTMGSTVLISRRLEGEFLNYRNSIPKTCKYSIEAEKRALINAIERVSLIINDRVKSPVRCLFGDNLLSVNTATALGRASDECVTEGNGENLEIGFNNKYILDALKAAPAEKLRLQLSTGVAPCIVVPADEKTNFLYMVLPVRLRANEN